MNWLLKLLFAGIGELLTAVIEVLAKLINNIFDVMYELNSNLKFDKLADYVLILALAFLSAYVVKKAFDIYVLQTDGDPDADPVEMITRSFVAAAVMICGKEVLEYGIKMSSVIAAEASSKIIPEKRTLSELAAKVLTSILTSATSQMFVYLIFMLVIVVAFLIFIFQAAKRGAELVLMQIILPVIACDLLTTNKERWNAFFAELLSTVFGYVIQLGCFNIFMMLFAQLVSKIDIKYMIASLSWLILILATPKWIQRFMYTSGMGNAAKGGVRSAAFVLPSILK